MEKERKKRKKERKKEEKEGGEGRGGHTCFLFNMVLSMADWRGPPHFGGGKKKPGGSLGWKVRGTLDAAFEKAAYELEPSTVGNPKFVEVKTGHGYHIIMVEGRRWVVLGRGGGKGKERSGSISLILASLTLFPRVNYTLSWCCLYYFPEIFF